MAEDQGMIKTGSPSKMVMGKVSAPQPSAVLLYKAEEGTFVPQPRLSEEKCACGALKTKFPDGSLRCESCGK